MYLHADIKNTSGTASGTKPAIKASVHWYLLTKIGAGTGTQQENVLGANLSDISDGTSRTIVTDQGTLGADFIGSLDKHFGSSGSWEKVDDTYYIFRATGKDELGGDYTLKLDVYTSSSKNNTFFAYYDVRASYKYTNYEFFLFKDIFKG